MAAGTEHPTESGSTQLRRSRPGGTWRTVLSFGLALPLLAWAMIRIGGLERGWPLVQVIALTPYALAVCLLSLPLVVLLRRWFPAVLLVLAGAGLVLAVGPRTFGSPDPVGPGHAVSVLAANLDRGRADPAELIGLATSRDVDLLVFTELTPEALDRLADSGIDSLYPERLVSPEPGTAGGGIWSRWPLGGPESNSAGDVPVSAAVLVPDAIPLGVAAVHVTPATGPRSTEEWSWDLQSLPRAGSGDIPLVLAGSFNATLDHIRLRQLIDTGYRDSGAATGRGLAFTWPARIGWPLPVAVDHVLAERGIGFSDYDVERIAGSDHRAVFAELVVPPVP